MANEHNPNILPGDDIVLNDKELYGLIGRLVAENSVVVQRIQAKDQALRQRDTHIEDLKEKIKGLHEAPRDEAETP